MADGGEGTARTILDACGGEWLERSVTGPLPAMLVEAGFAWLPETRVAVVEMAAASGLDLLGSDQLDPVRATSHGTGELIAAALDQAPDRLWLGLGGSATVDGGVGAAQALGWRFLDAGGLEIGLGADALTQIDRIIEPATDQRSPDLSVEVLCDVDNPLLGERGAARVFAPQKGASQEQVEHLEAGLTNLARLIERDLGLAVADVAGAGAAGGMGAGAIAFLGARLVRGVDAVMDAVGLEGALHDADWVITGEGCFDSQSLHGKVVSGVARRAAARKVRTAVVAGAVQVEPTEARRAGIEDLEAVATVGMPIEEARRGASSRVQAAAERLAARLT
jgi:glycerate kinase